MKKYLIFLLLCSVVGYGQVSPVKVVRVIDSTKIFNSELAQGTILINTFDNKTYQILKSIPGTKKLSNCTINVDYKQTQDDVTTPTKDPTGFLDNTTSHLAFTNHDRTFAITGNYTTYYRGTPTMRTGGTLQITDVSGLHYIYYNSAGALTELVNSWPGFDQVLVAFVYWNAATGKGLLNYERHGIGMDWTTHEYLHETRGAVWKSGMGATFGNTTFSIDGGEWYDEDLEHLPGAKTTVTILYHSGDTNFVWDTLQTNYVKMNGANIRYNNGNSLADVGSNNYVAYWIFVTPDSLMPYVSVMGQRTDPNIADARANNKFELLSLGTLPFVEMKLLYRVILRNDGSPYEETADYRSTSAIANNTYVATSHSTLTGLTADDHTQYQLSNGTRAETINPATTDLDKFVVDSSGFLKYRTGTEVLSDIGAATTTQLGAKLDTTKATLTMRNSWNSALHFSDTIAKLATKYDLDTLNVTGGGDVYKDSVNYFTKNQYITQIIDSVDNARGLSMDITVRKADDATPMRIVMAVDSAGVTYGMRQEINVNDTVEEFAGINSSYVIENGSVIYGNYQQITVVSANDVVGTRQEIYIADTVDTYIGIGNEAQIVGGGLVYGYRGSLGLGDGEGAPGAVDSSYQIYITSPNLNPGSTIRKSYGLYMEDQKVGDSTSYAIYSEGGNSWLADTMDVEALKINHILMEPYNKWSIYNEGTGKIPTYGALYNWYAVNTGKLCPTGWSVPTYTEDSLLLLYLEANGYGYEGSGDDIAKSMASTTGWVVDATPGHIGNDPGTNNSSGLNMYPSGYRSDGFKVRTISALYWCGSLYYLSQLYPYPGSIFMTGSEIVSLYFNYAYVGGAVRCIKDDSNDPGTVTDYDGNVYSTVDLGGQIRTTSSLITTHLNDGTAIYGALVNISDNDWDNLHSPAMCYYDNDPANAFTYSGTGNIDVTAEDTVEYVAGSGISITKESVRDGYKRITITGSESPVNNITPIQVDGNKAWIGDSAQTAYFESNPGLFTVVDTTSNRTMNDGILSILTADSTSIGIPLLTGINTAYGAQLINHYAISIVSDTVKNMTGIKNSLDINEAKTVRGIDNIVNVDGTYTDYIFGIYSNVGAVADSVVGVYSIVPSGHTFFGDGGELHNVGDINTTTEYQVNGVATVPIYEVTHDLSSARIMVLYSEGDTLVAAPGSGKAIEALSCSFKWIYAGNAYDAKVHFIYVGTTRNNANTAQFSLGTPWEGTATTYQKCAPYVTSITALEDNKPLILATSTDDAANGTSTLRVYITYRIITL